MLNRLTIFFIFVLSAAIGSGRDIYVATNGTTTSPYTNWAQASSNIQWAVNVSVNGDTLWISNGTYVLTNQITVSSNISIIGWPGGQPIIDGNNSNRCFYIPSATVTLSNLFITRGCTNDYGGGVYRGILLNCTLYANIAANGGGAYNSSATNCSFICNVAFTNGGGVYGGSVYCGTFASNIAQSGCGGGLYFSAASSVISNSFISNNIATNSYGGGLYINSGGQVKNCIIARNIAFGGGGMYMMSGTILVKNCIIEENICWIPYSHNGGGGIANEATGSTVQNCLLRNNVVSGGDNDGYGGGGILVRYGALNIRNCAIVSNYSSIGPGGISLMDASHVVKAENSIIYFNKSDNPVAYSNYFNASSTASSYSNCCTAPALSDVIVTNNITANPQFVDWTSGNYHLSQGSPCINAGVNRSWMDFDLDGLGRIDHYSGIVDMGCYEYLPAGMMITIP